MIVYDRLQNRLGNSTTGGGISNEICGSSLGISGGETKTFHCDSTKFGRYVYVRIPGSIKSLSFCEIQVYSTISSNFTFSYDLNIR